MSPEHRDLQGGGAVRANLGQDGDVLSLLVELDRVAVNYTSRSQWSPVSGRPCALTQDRGAPVALCHAWCVVAAHPWMCTLHEPRGTPTKKRAFRQRSQTPATPEE